MIAEITLLIALAIQTINLLVSQWVSNKVINNLCEKIDKLEQSKNDTNKMNFNVTFKEENDTNDEQDVNKLN